MDEETPHGIKEILARWDRADGGGVAMFPGWPAAGLLRKMAMAFFAQLEP